MDIYINESDNYLSYFIQKEQESKGNDSRVSLAGASDAAVEQFSKSDSSKNGEIGLRAMDRVDISAEARQLQQVLKGEKYDSQNQQKSLGEDRRASESPLHGLASGKSDAAGTPSLSNKKLLAFSEATRPSEAAPESDDINEQLRELKKQLQDAMKRLGEAQSKLAAAQAEARMDNAETAGSADPAAPVQRDANSQEKDNKAVPNANAPTLDTSGSTAVQAAQQELAACSAEVAEIQQQMQNLLSEQSGGGGGGGSGSIQPVAGRTWSPQGTTNFNVGG